MQQFEKNKKADSKGVGDGKLVESIPGADMDYKVIDETPGVKDGKNKPKEKPKDNKQKSGAVAEVPEVGEPAPFNNEDVYAQEYPEGMMVGYDYGGMDEDAMLAQVMMESLQVSKPAKKKPVVAVSADEQFERDLAMAMALSAGSSPAVDAPAAAPAAASH